MSREQTVRGRTSCGNRAPDQQVLIGCQRLDALASDKVWRLTSCGTTKVPCRRCPAFCGMNPAPIYGDKSMGRGYTPQRVVSDTAPCHGIADRRELENDIMATLAVDGDDLVVRLSALEKIGALRGNIRVPLGSVRAVRISDAPWSELRGIRAPGTGLPGIISLCTRRGADIHDFAAVYGRRPALVIEMAGASFDRLVVSCADAADAAARAADITRASGLAHAPR